MTAPSTWAGPHRSLTLGLVLLVVAGVSLADGTATRVQASVDHVTIVLRTP